MILWFPINVCKEKVLNYVQEFARDTFPQILQDRIHSRFPSFDHNKVCIDAEFNEIDLQCSICYEQGDYQLHCGHVFHKRCITKWKESSRSCPLCRASI